MGTIVISAAVRAKLEQKHNVTRLEVCECFDNRCGVLLIDDREEHRRDPPTLWFIAETNTGRPLKVVFQVRSGNMYVITAYEANDIEMNIYETKGK
ncbi:ADP-ribosyl-(dinitrogen reductase) hydrolase [Rugamonas sp. CCM 8940]|uniref:ADP-ribosyl-(dinitrogen reductase) hydrolase n=1 Tax=Rugamonas sp. CCM 8940 TaxID=2765359 RepID=UPI0018F38375|nr:ADP-ribosyl-(dinitrogen reductase) hydrolase [Rugamonas sp. CCM 8940]MBJ7314108.1 ADP-ribosyl-(dinitrogen reductase) hydrolase [Rugamonas sp. CCM 8940]